MAQYTVSVSVRRLVEFILKSGDIDSGSGGLIEVDAMQQGAKLHRKLQKAAGPSYQAEVHMKTCIHVDEEIDIVVEGRADGVITEYRLETGADGVLTQQETVTIDEIKGTYRDLNHIPEPKLVHMAQAACYAYMYAKDHDCAVMGLQLTYAHLETGRIRQFHEERDFGTLSVWFEELVFSYAAWAKWQLHWKEKRNVSIEKCDFPFDYRESQRKLVSGVYRTIQQGKRLFIEAPTGTGKTISVIYPAVRAVGEGMGEKIFYLTAKTIARTVAEDTFLVLQEQGLDYKVITLTAKEKLCIFDEVHCQPEYCPRAKGHFDRVNEAVFALINQETAVTRTVIEDYAERYNVCPFEMQLDVSEWMDAIICDYNYVFDPRVALKRFFAEGKGDYLFLADEAHNLVERAREMYSAVLLRSDFLKVKKCVKGLDRKLTQYIEACSSYLLDLEIRSDETWEELENVNGLTVLLTRLITQMSEVLKKDGLTQEMRDGLMNLYFSSKTFMDTYDRMDDRYRIYCRRPGKELFVKLLCVDPSGDLSERLELGRSTVFFSATLLPIHYYKEMLSTTAEKDYDLYVDSPFDQEKRLLITAGDVSSRYTRRNLREFEKIARYIHDIIRSRNGNYMVFFPSYQYMQQVYDVFAERELSKAGHGLQVVVQEASMAEAARQEFLDSFTEMPDATTIGFCVLGGIFSEGIDLKADRLIGVIIVGTGLPQIGEERELLRQYFDEKNGCGFDYAYLYPGMNKVLQAGGRVIRTEEDVGVIALLDERFNYRQYRALFPREWSDCRSVNMENITACIDDFWSEKC